jgi:serine kinase of HPr protein (carbohydrate metabolism regulator)
MPLVHATCVVIDGRGILLRGPSGAGKSDLALRLIEAGAGLVADDQVHLEAQQGRVIASAPQSLYGLIEVRGLGPVRLDARQIAPPSPLAAVISLGAGGAVERLPEPAEVCLAGIPVPEFHVAPFEASAAAKLRLVASRGGNGAKRASPR